MLKIFDFNYENEYIEKTNELGNKYFDMGNDWGYIQKPDTYNLSKKEVFDSFNKPYIYEGIDKGASFNLANDPWYELVNSPDTSYANELKILLEKGYKFEKYGGIWRAFK